MSELTVSKYSGICGKMNCRGETAIAMMVAENEYGDTKCGPGSEFLALDNHGNPIHPAQMANGNIFKHWITRCSNCYLDDLEQTPPDAIHRGDGRHNRKRRQPTQGSIL